MRKNGTVSLILKIILLVGISTVVIGFATTKICMFLYHKIAVEDRTDLCRSVAKLAASTVDGDRIDEYLAEGEKAKGYTETKQRLLNIRSNTPEIKYLYVYKIEADGVHVVFDLDTPDTTANDPGDVFPFDRSFFLYIDDLLAGESIEPVISDDTFGWLLTVYQPVYDSKGVCVAYAGADIPMENISKEDIHLVIRIVSFVFGAFVVILALALWLSEQGQIYLFKDIYKD